MSDLASLLTLANFLVIVGGIIGGWLVLRSSIAKSRLEVQERIRKDLHDENEVLRNRVLRLETENKRMSKVIQLIVTTLKKLHNIELDIDEDIITLRSPNGNVSRVSADAP